MSDVVRRGVVDALAKELVTDQVIDLVAGRVVAPVVAYFEGELTVIGSVGGLTGAAAVLDRLRNEAEAEERRTKAALPTGAARRAGP